MDNYEINSLSEKKFDGSYVFKNVSDIWKHFYSIESDSTERLLEELSVRQDMSTMIANAGPSGAAKSTATALPLTAEITALYHNGISPTQTSKINNVISCLYNDIPITTVVIKYRNENRILEKLMVDAQSVIADRIIASHCKLDEEDISFIVNNIITPTKAADYDLADCVEIASIAALAKEIKKITTLIVGNPNQDSFLEKVVSDELKKIDESNYEKIRNIYEMEITKRVSSYTDGKGNIGERVLFKGILDILKKSIESVKEHMTFKLEVYKKDHSNCVDSLETDKDKKYVIIFENSDLDNMQDMLSDIYTNHKYSVLIEQIQYFTPANNLFMETFEKESEITGRKLDEDGYLNDISHINGILCTISDTRGTDDARADGYNKNEALNGAISIIKQTNPDSTYMYLNIMTPTANFHKIYEAVKRQTKSPVKIIVTHIDDFVEKFILTKREANISISNEGGKLSGHKSRLTAKQKAALKEKTNNNNNENEKKVIKVTDFTLEEVIEAFKEINKRINKNGFNDMDDIVKICLVKSECQEVIDEMSIKSLELQKLIGGNGKLYSVERFYKEIYGTVEKHLDKYQSVGNMKGVNISINTSKVMELARKCKNQHEAVIKKGLNWEENHNGKCELKDEPEFYYKYRYYYPHWKTKDAVLRYNAIGEGWTSNANVYDNVSINIPALCRSFISISDIKSCIEAEFDNTIRLGEKKLVNEALSKNLSSYQYDLKKKISIQVCSNGIEYFGFYDLLDKCEKALNDTNYWVDQLNKVFKAITERMAYVTLK